MSKLPQVSGRECIKALAKAGFYEKRRHGSHIILRQAEISVDEFIALL
ncbi:MAG: type II toxin-antitoxin system HicA family toxin [Burkholderiales bacterium]